MSSIEAPVPSDLLRLGRADRDEVILVLDAQRVNGEEWRVLMRKAKQAAGTIMPIELDISMMCVRPIVLRPFPRKKDAILKSPCSGTTRLSPCS